MKWYKNRKIGTKLMLGFLIVVLTTIALGVFGLINTFSSDRTTQELYSNAALPLSNIGKIGFLFNGMGSTARNLVMDPDNQEEYIQALTDGRAQIKDYLAEQERLSLNQSEEERALLNELVTDLDTMFAYHDRIIGYVQEGHLALAESAVLSETAELRSAIETTIFSLYDGYVGRVQQKADESALMSRISLYVMLVCILLAVAISIGLGVAISRMIARPIRQLVRAAERLADGSVDVEVKATTKDEVGQLMESFEKLIGNTRRQAEVVEHIAAGELDIEVEVRSEDDFLNSKLREMIQKNNEVLSSISVASQQVSAGAVQLSDSSMALSQGATEQASSIEELTASLEEIGAKTRLNAENAGQANELAEDAKQSAVQGNAHMKDMLAAMEEISASSANISKIIKVIDDIAFQTNILALNAAVEAARAGQHGRGFAVVAEEVRNLAARSADAAKETTELIEGSIHKVEDGTKIADNTAQALDSIVGSVTRVAELVGGIAAASEEQSAGVAQINQGITQVANVVQTNSATAEESASASEELAGQAELLKSQVGRYKLKKAAFAPNREAYLPAKGERKALALSDADEADPMVVRFDKY